MKRKRRIAIPATLAVAACLSEPAAAQVADLLDTLLKNGAITPDQYEQLKEQQRTEQQTDQSRGPAVPAPPPPQDLVVTTTGGLRGRSPDSSFTFQLLGRLMIDFASFPDDRINLTVPDGAPTELGDGTELRRARIEVMGTAWNDWGYRAGYDFAEDEVEIKNAYVEYTGFDPIALRVGQFKEPFSLEDVTSSSFITFMERGLPNVFAPGFNIGVGALSYADKWTFDGGLFFEGVDDQNDDDDGEFDEGYALTGRLTYAPIADGRKLLHLGVSGSYRVTGDDDEVRFRERPESHITAVRFVNTGDLSGVDNITRLGLEALAVHGPFSVQAEYITSRLDGAIAPDLEVTPGLGEDDRFSDLDFDGFYVYGSWFITGETRSFRYERGEPGRAKPRGIVGKGGKGAWEVALRFSSIDLTDGKFDGGKEDNITLGLNWYPTPNVRFMANYIEVDAEKGDDDNDPTIFSLRAQMDF